MNTCTINANLKNTIIKYITLLIKSEQLHNKLESLYFKISTTPSNFIKKQILNINNALNHLLVEIMKLQWIVELQYY